MKHTPKLIAALLIGAVATFVHAAEQGALKDKTLVAWIAPANLTQRGGSALTIQRGDQFDGIVFGEKVAGKWMAGSDGFTRTQQDQFAGAVETADSKTLIQMAIVYKGNQISIYRNGKPYVSYEASNIDLLCDEKGGNGFAIASGAGSRTLTVDYINPPFELKANEDLTLRIFIDKSMIEVFANDRQAAVAWHEYKPENLNVSLFAKGGDLVVKQVTAWKMKSICEGD